MFINFQIGYGSVAWVIVAEILPTNSRSTLYPLALAFMWMVNFILTQHLTDLHNCYTFWTFSVFSILGLIFIIAFIPETKGKTSSEIESYWSRSASRLNESTETEPYIVTV